MDRGLCRLFWCGVIGRRDGAVDEGTAGEQRRGRQTWEERPTSRCVTSTPSIYLKTTSEVTMHRSCSPFVLNLE